MGKIRWVAAAAVGLVALGVLARSHVLDGVVRALGGGRSSVALSDTTWTAGPGGVSGAAQSLAVGGLSGWQYLGPNNVGGPTSYVTYDPVNPSVLYAVSYAGDLFRSSDAGVTWNHLSNLPLRGAQLEIPSGQSQTMYAYAKSKHWYSMEGYPPLFKSTDGGNTWTHIDPSNWIHRGFIGEINRLRTVPGQPNTLWATTAQGIAKSEDDGATWSLIFTQGGSTTCTDLEVSGAYSTVYAACRTPYWNVVAIDPDGVWTQVTQRTGTESQEARLALSKSDERVIYFATFGDNTNPNSWPSYLSTVSRTSDGGQSWEVKYDRSQLTDPVSSSVPGDFDYECLAPGYNFLTQGDKGFAVDPANPNQLWIAGFEIFRSDDGGATFGRMRERAEHIDDPALGVGEGVPAYSRYASIAFPPNYNGTTIQTMFVGGYTGIERTSNAQVPAPASPSLSCSSKTASGAVWEARNSGYAVARLVHGDVSNTGEMVISGPDINTAVSTGNGPDGWVELTALRGVAAVGQPSLDPVEGLGRFLVGTAQWQWNSAANNWSAQRTNFFSGTTLGYQLAWEAPVFWAFYFPRYARDPNDRMHLVSADSLGVFESRDGGSNWFLISPNIKVQASGFKRDGTVIASTDDGFVLSQTGPGARTWEKRDLNGCLLVQGNTCGKKSARFHSFVLNSNPSDPGVYATTEYAELAKVWYSADGRTWQELDRPQQEGGLPALFGNTTLAIDTDNPRHLYAGTPLGLYASEDNGQNWSPAEAPFPRTPVSSLKFVKEPSGARRLVAFTYGRGAWSATVAPSTAFVDVPTYAWSYDYVRRLYAAGITNGCGGTPPLYCPGAFVSRDQMAVFLLRAMHGSTYQPPAAIGYFVDVPVNHWAAGWIERLRGEGITNGCAANPARYCPSDVVSREQMAIFLLRAKYGVSYTPPPAIGVFADVPANHWAAAWIEQLSREGITSGCSSSPALYCPGNPVTREQMAVFLVRAFAL